MTKSYFKMVPTTCRRANARGRYLGGIVMTKSYFKMVSTTCRRDEGEGATHIIREEKSHTWKECLLPLLWFYVTIKEERKNRFRRPAAERERGGDTYYTRRNDYEKQRSKRHACSIISGSVFYDGAATESTGSEGGSDQFSTGSSEDGE